MNGSTSAAARSEAEPIPPRPPLYAETLRGEIEQLLSAGQAQAAVRALESFNREAPDDEEATSDLAVLYHASRRATDARILLGAFVAAHPDGLLARKRLALIELIAGDAKSALAIIEPVLVRAPADAEALRIVGDIAVAMKRPERARAFYLEALKSAPGDAETQSRLAALPSTPAAQPAPARAFSDRLALGEFFAQVPIPYAVLRLSPDFPHYQANEDIDLLCANREPLRAHLRSVGARYEAIGFRVEESLHDGHLHLDFFAPGASRLDFRFDLLEGLGSYSKIRIDPAWTSALLGRCRTLQQGGATVSVPAQPDEQALRLLEYLQYRDIRPEKLKHLQHVLASGSTDFLRPLAAHTDLKLSIGNQAVSCELPLGAAALRPVEPAAAPGPARPRVDYFLIWGHGLTHAREILEIIRAQDAFDILSIYRRNVGDMARFVQRVYECDAVPMQHLIAKTRYLLQVPPEVLLVVARNRQPREAYYGEGPFRHIQCARVKEVKERVRERFNPRVGGKRTEHHVIHASDYQSQTEHVLRVMGLPGVAAHEREPNPRLLAPHHIAPFTNYRLREVAIAQLRANILGLGAVPIEATPHYQYAQGERAPYIDYQARYAGQQLTDDHYPEAFDRLIASYDPARDERGGKKSYILAAPRAGGELLVLDGVHRAALLAARGVKTCTIAEPLPERAAGAPVETRYRASPTCQIPGLAGLYQQYLGYKTDGLFVEVGAFDGEYVSNTSTLADLGWTGHYIEPVPEHVAACRKRHAKNPRTQVHELAIAEKEGEATLHVGGVLSTMDPESLKLYETFDWAKGIHTGRSITVKQITLDQFLLAQGIPPEFDLLVIDVEGFEWNVLQGFSIERWRPRMAIIELHDENENYRSIRESCRKVAAAFRANGYRAVYKDPTNTVFVRG